MCWLWTPGDPWREGIEADLDMGVSGLWALTEVTAAAREAGRPARIQLKADTGLGRNGCQPADWPELVAAALDAEAEGTVKVTGLWSHFACADEPGHPSIAAQLDVFREMVAYAEKEGVEPEVRHLANSPATLTLPDSHFDLVRTGIAMYGISPSPELGTHEELGLRPVMTLAASLALVKQVPAGHGVSYGHHYVTSHETTLGLVPSATRTASRATRPAGVRCWSAANGTRSRGGSPWTSSWWTSVGRRSTKAPRHSCSGRVTGASRPPRTGRRRQGPSPTKSSPASEQGFRASI